MRNPDLPEVHHLVFDHGKEMAWYSKLGRWSERDIAVALRQMDRDLGVDHGARRIKRWKDLSPAAKRVLRDEAHSYRAQIARGLMPAHIVDRTTTDLPDGGSITVEDLGAFRFTVSKTNGRNDVEYVERERERALSSDGDALVVEAAA